VEWRRERRGLGRRVASSVTGGGLDKSGDKWLLDERGD
jgi:hypothetical protein